MTEHYKLQLAKYYVEFAIDNEGEKTTILLVGPDGDLEERSLDNKVFQEWLGYFPSVSATRVKEGEEEDDK
ncbi:MAG: hypothetical protein V3U49_03985 [Nitrososphaerales archaeon]